MRHIFLLGLLAFPAAAFADPPVRKPVVLTDEAKAIHMEALVADGHNDLPWQMREKGSLSFSSLDISRDQKKLQTDIPRLRKGNVGVQCWAAYVPVETMKQGIAVKQTLEQIDVIHRMVKTYPDTFEFATTVADIERIRKSGKIASLIGVEGGHSIDNSLGVLRMYHQLGVRYMTLTHTQTLDWADAATDKPKSNGLSKFGEDVVGEMNRLGMMVDLSHVSPDTMKHAIRISKAPVIFSHSSARALADHARNVPDDVLKLTSANGGIVMVNFYSGFVVPEAARIRKDMFNAANEIEKKYPDEAKRQEAMKEWRRAHPIPKGTIHDVIDHIEHLVKVAGIDHVGIGSDFDGIDAWPEQLDGVDSYPLITQELLNRGYKKEQILKILGGNFMRVMKGVEAAAGK
ncbi:dipeptidase [Zavarzinella formosa]|uniref:dipeptidase n=1 Tax=Zavarzinella formosa TaxID=360055 RepID=UPI0002E71F60|nr:dipeptidase [Zavarzinella formosa]